MDIRPVFKMEVTILAFDLIGRVSHVENPL